MVHLRESFTDGILSLSEAKPGLFGDNIMDPLPRFFLHNLIKVKEGPLESLGDRKADRRLPRTDHATQVNIHKQTKGSRIQVEKSPKDLIINKPRTLESSTPGVL
ncbi:MAG: hypothetical protein A2156_07130 [Deltaproteobacteria bacterium RBG_16_48_10]|nr:MAG: hypothetical protein A2156_07130 [Deltaproteobacteria bacterium RBG_16_48_10]